MSNNKLIVVLGGGESGVGAAYLAQQKGFEVFVSDMGAIPEGQKQKLLQWGIPFEEGQHSEDKILGALEVIKSPGIPEKAPLIKLLKAKGISVIGEIEFAGRYTQAQKICITGSNGKSTTTMLTYHILKNAGLRVGLAGNIGKSFAYQVATEDFEVYVLEISSFMLDDMYQFKADIAVLLNITPDHLDRYDYKLENYAQSKFRIVQNQTQADYFIYCEDDEETMRIIKQQPIKANKMPFSLNNKPFKNGAWMHNDDMKVASSSGEFSMPIERLALSGKHNVYNSMAAAIVAKIKDIREDQLRGSLEDFKNIAHRLEEVDTINGIRFVNDSKATNVNSTWYALESMKSKVILILGGVDKGNDYEMLKPLVKSKVKAIVCLGKDNSKIHQVFDNEVEVIVNTFSASDAVQVAYHLAKKGDTVLLSPACASFDLFKNYEDRGDQFKKAVKEIL